MICFHVSRASDDAYVVRARGIILQTGLCSQAWLCVCCDQCSCRCRPREIHYRPCMFSINPDQKQSKNLTGVKPKWYGGKGEPTSIVLRKPCSDSLRVFHEFVGAVLDAGGLDK